MSNPNNTLEMRLLNLGVHPTLILECITTIGADASIDTAWQWCAHYQLRRLLEATGFKETAPGRFEPRTWPGNHP